MPTYEYVCKECGNKFEQFQKMSDMPLIQCPDCEGQVERLIGKGAGLIVKGSESHAISSRNKNPLSNCDRSSPCCGRSNPCDKPPCDSKF
jgi:putative FmdB family regulatory protein